MLQQQRTVGSKTAVEILGGIVTYRQVTHWLATGVLSAEGRGIGSGTQHRLTLDDVLRFRAMGLLVASTNHGWSLRDAAAEIKCREPSELLSPITIVEGRASITVDLSLDEEDKLKQWLEEEQQA